MLISSVVLTLVLGPNAGWICDTWCVPSPDACVHQSSAASARLSSAEHCAPDTGAPAASTEARQAPQVFAAIPARAVPVAPTHATVIAAADALLRPMRPVVAVLPLRV